MRIAFAPLGAALLLSGLARAGALSDEAAGQVLAALEGASGSAAREALARVVETDDRRFTAVLIELVRASEVGIAAPGVRDESIQALEHLTGEDLGADWPAWVRWYAGTELAPPPGFVGWKGRLLGRIDPAFEGLLRDEHPARIRVEEIVWGGVPFEGIPALDRPPHVPAAEAGYLDDDEPVFGVRVGDEARAYPLRILDWHEMANDELGGVPFSLAYCTLCGTGIVYDTRVPGHGTLDFGSSGFLMRSNKLMVDRQTKTLWNQFTGRPVLGPLAGEEIRLRLIPSVVTRWKDWRERHPETSVLSLETGYARPYHPGASYAGYFASDTTMFPVRAPRDELAPKERIFGLERDGLARAWRLESLLERGVLNDHLGELAIVLVAGDARIWVEGRSVRSGPARYEAGAAVRAYRRGARSFRAAADSGALVDEAGRRWSLAEDALRGPEGERLERLPGVLAYWFGWQSFHPHTQLYGTHPTEHAS